MPRRKTTRTQRSASRAHIETEGFAANGVNLKNLVVGELNLDLGSLMKNRGAAVRINRPRAVRSSVVAELSSVVPSTFCLRPRSETRIHRAIFSVKCVASVRALQEPCTHFPCFSSQSCTSCHVVVPCREPHLTYLPRLARYALESKSRDAVHHGESALPRHARWDRFSALETN